MKVPVLAKISGGVCLLIAAFGVGVVVSPVIEIVKGIVVGRTLQRLQALEGGHHAELLKKHNLADINFIVKVDGDAVYVSPDFVHLPDHLYRETLVWDETGRVVVLELLGKRVFAYDAINRTQLGKGELSRYKFYPALSDDYFYASIRDIDAVVEE